MRKQEGVAWSITIAIVALLAGGMKSCLESESRGMQRRARDEMRACARLLGLAQTSADSVWVRFEAPTQCEGRWAWHRNAPAVPRH